MTQRSKENAARSDIYRTRWSTGSALKYSRPGCGNLWLAHGLDTRSLDPPWLCFRTLAKAIRQRHNGGHKSGSHASKARSRRPHADHGPQPSIIRPRVLAGYCCLSVCLELSLHADFVRYCSVHPSSTTAICLGVRRTRCANVGMVQRFVSSRISVRVSYVDDRR